MYFNRTLEKFVGKAAKQFPVLLVTGARQVGKTTFLQHLSRQNRTYVSLDDPMVLNLAKSDPALFMQRFTPPLLIDEIQYAPELLPYIKMAVDRARKPGLFWLTGSQQFHLMKGVSESLAGRVGVIHLFGFSRRELLRQSEASRPFIPEPKEIQARMDTGGAMTLQQLYRLIWRGSLPAIALNAQMDRDLFYGSYLQTYLRRDIHDLARVGDEMAFLRFLRVAAARTGQLLNVAELARDSDVSFNTAKGWLSVLQASGVVYLLEPYFNNVTKRLVKTPKMYFPDTGLACYLTQWSSPETLESGAMAGAILETWVITELLKGYAHNGLHAPFYFYRDKDLKEIDLLIVRDDALYPVEIKRTASPRADDVRHFKTLDRLGMSIGPGGLICLAQQALPLTANVSVIPAAAM
ncbi:MAG TPA: ATP-binding protein [bacterium]|nr:ATP-binding protein [bacterium]